MSVWIVFSKVLSPRQFLCTLKAGLLETDNLHRVLHVVLANMYADRNESLTRLLQHNFLPVVRPRFNTYYVYGYIHDGVYSVDPRNLPSAVFIQYMQRHLAQHNTKLSKALQDIIDKYPGPHVQCRHCGADLPESEMQTDTLCISCAYYVNVRRNKWNSLMYSLSSDPNLMKRVLHLT